MRTDLKRISTLEMSREQWLQYRQNGIGGSEVATIMGLNKWKSSHALFYEKVEGTTENISNAATHWGTLLEEQIANNWQYWSGTSDSMIANFATDNKVRKCRKVNAYLINPEYPHLFASVDRVINKGDNETEGILECKTISGFAADQWEAGIPPMYLVQLQAYLLVTGLEYGEIAILKDGRYMEVYEFQRLDTITEDIINQTTEFWNLVTQARALRAAGKSYEHLEPKIENQEAYESFLKDKFRKATIETKIAAGMDYYNAGIEIQNINKMMKPLEDKKKELQNFIKGYMQDSELMDFGGSGKITWKNNKDAFEIDSKKLAEEQPDIYHKYTKATPGARVLRISLKESGTVSKEKAA